MVCLISSITAPPVERDEAFRFEIKDVIVHDVPGQYLVVHHLPRLFWDRYVEIPQNIFVRDCYGKLYTIVSDLMFGGLMNHGVTLFTGAPGIGKSLFLIYFIYRFLHDNRFPDKRFAVEFDSGNYWYFQPTSEGIFSCILRDGHYFWDKDFLLLCDIMDLDQPLSRSKWTFVFSSPFPMRYKDILKNSPHIANVERAGVDVFECRYWSVVSRLRCLWRGASVCAPGGLWDIQIVRRSIGPER